MPRPAIVVTDNMDCDPLFMAAEIQPQFRLALPSIAVRQARAIAVD